MTFMPMNWCILSHLVHTLSSAPVTPLLSILCHQPDSIHIDYISNIYQIFPKFSLVLYMTH